MKKSHFYKLACAFALICVCAGCGGATTVYSSSSSRTQSHSGQSSSANNEPLSSSSSSATSSSSSAVDSSSSSSAADSSSSSSSVTRTSSESPAVAYISLNYQEIDLYCTETIQLIATAYPKKAETSFDFVSGNPSIATIDDNGKIKGLLAGTTVITVVAENGVYATCRLTVRDPMGGGTEALFVGDEYTFSEETKSNADQIEIATEDPSIIKAISNRKIQAIAVGQTNVYFRNKETKEMSGTKMKIYVTNIRAYSYWTLFDEYLGFYEGKSGVWKYKIDDIKLSTWTIYEQVYFSFAFSAWGDYDNTRGEAEKVNVEAVVYCIKEDVSGWTKEEILRRTSGRDSEVQRGSIGYYNVIDLFGRGKTISYRGNFNNPLDCEVSLFFRLELKQ